MPRLLSLVYSTLKCKDQFCPTIFLARRAPLYATENFGKTQGYGPVNTIPKSYTNVRAITLPRGSNCAEEVLESVGNPKTKVESVES